ncbi:ABC transporter ATP-binding protein [Pendulispora albinea]|uniref:ABC transporter ATP-binding protein n=1 Tax=Pendulispora albinea TaxID=2741071 RepID=A0ABZ2MCH5_9BACT
MELERTRTNAHARATDNGGGTPNGAAAEKRPVGEERAPAEAIIRLRGVAKEYRRGGETLRILHELDLDVGRGAFEALMGPSGSGKTTLLNLIGGLDHPTRGSLEVAGARLDQMNDAELAEWRSQTLGIIFQAYNLLPVLTAVENVELPLLLTTLSGTERKKRAQTALKIVGLENRMGHYPRQLSGGQEQRVAIARAIVNDPAVIIADEPTGDLDRQSANEILAIFEKLYREMGKTIVMVTHDPTAAERASIIRRLDKGALV